MSEHGTDGAGRGEAFLGRWSRRKLAPDPAPDPRRPDQPADTKPAPVESGKTAHPITDPADLPALDMLDGLKSEYQAFMQSNVSDATRREALKQLFSDPHFNVMDGLDTYIDDYSIEDPIPEAMLRGLTQARGLSLFEESRERDASPTIQPGTAGTVVQADGAPAADTEGAAAPGSTAVQPTADAATPGAGAINPEGSE